MRTLANESCLISWGYGNQKSIEISLGVAQKIKSDFSTKFFEDLLLEVRKIGIYKTLSDSLQLTSQFEISSLFGDNDHKKSVFKSAKNNLFRKIGNSIYGILPYRVGRIIVILIMRIQIKMGKTVLGLSNKYFHIS